MRFLALILIFCSLGCDRGAANPPGDVDKNYLPKQPDPIYNFRAAAGSVKITPTGDLPLGGFNINRVSIGVHDDLYARCVILRCPEGSPLVLVALDFVGFIRYDVVLVKKALAGEKDIDTDSVFLFATHQHSGPDTVGIWGASPLPVPPLTRSGRNESYMREVREKIVQLIKDTNRRLEEAQILFSSADAPGFSKNRRVPKELDTRISGLFIKGRQGQIATLVNFGCHPEALDRDNKLITADFPGYLVRRVEEKIGGTAIFVNGLLGGMVSITGKNLENKESGFLQAEELGRKLADILLASSPEARRLDCRLRVQTKVVSIPLENLGFHEAFKFGIIPNLPEIFDQRSGNVRTEVSIVTLGNVRLVMVPGEMIPGLGIKIKNWVIEKQPGVIPIICGLANDEIGYILPTEDFFTPRYKYEHTMSLGPKTGDTICEALKTLAAN